MKNALYKLLFVATGSALLLAGCVGDLDQYPKTSTTSNDVYAQAENYDAVLAGIYTTLLIRQSYVADDDRYQSYSRCLMMFQDCSTDQIDDVWQSGESMTDVNNQSWTAGDPWVSAMYYHVYNVVAQANEFIRNSTDDAISRFGEAEQEHIRVLRNEARAIRALAYYHALDLFPAAPFVTENDPVGSFIPPVYTRQQIFEFLEGELLELGDGSLPLSGYGHMTRGAANALLARMYLNAEVYIGEPKYTECIEACRKVMEDGYSLESDYTKLFNADNHLRTNEIIFSLAVNSTHTVTWDASTFTVAGPVIANYDDMDTAFGVDGAWDCLRARPQLVDLFEQGDGRGLFIGHDRKRFADAPADYYEKEGDTEYKYLDRSKEIIGHDETTSGWRYCKWTNLTDDGQMASSTNSVGVETDYPIFRLADVYLMFAEAVVRGGSGATREEALTQVNLVRARAFGNESGNIGDSELTLDFLLAERGRELYSESIRRTDLIRFGLYTTGYLWNWKGGVMDGTNVLDKFNVLPIPEAELSANPELKNINVALGY